MYIYIYVCIIRSIYILKKVLGSPDIETNTIGGLFLKKIHLKDIYLTNHKLLMYHHKNLLYIVIIVLIVRCFTRYVMQPIKYNNKNFVQ